MSLLLVAEALLEKQMQKKFKQEGANIILIDKKYNKQMLEGKNLKNCY